MYPIMHYNVASTQRVDSFHSNLRWKKLWKGLRNCLEMDDSKRRIYVGSLSFKTDEESLRELCEKYGTIEDGMTLYFAFC